MQRRDFLKAFMGGIAAALALTHKTGGYTGGIVPLPKRDSLFPLKPGETILPGGWTRTVAVADPRRFADFMRGHEDEVKRVMTVTYTLNNGRIKLHETT